MNSNNQTPADYGDMLAELVIDSINEQKTDVAKQILFSRVMQALQKHPLYRPPKPQTAKIEPMNDAQATAFENSTIPFGKYVGKQVWDVPLDYLCRLTDPSDWIKELKRYLASKRLQGELNDAIE